MKERPILFSAPMVRAILDGRKTQTRRIVKIPAGDADRYASGIVDVTPFIGRDDKPTHEFGLHSFPRVISSHVRCPYGAPGDRLRIRETWQYADWTEDGLPWIRYAADGAKLLREGVTDEWADRVGDAWAALSSAENVAIDGIAADRKWRPSIFLPRWASRLTLDVVSVRVERLQAISEMDAKAEGVRPFFETMIGIGRDQRISTGELAADAEHRAAFACLWDEINGDRALWSSNPWVWVVEFRRVQ